MAIRVPTPTHAAASGFSLSELMVAVAIVGILSALALPNFANQANKAKASEAKILASAAVREAHIAWSEAGSEGLSQWQSEQCPRSTRMFQFQCNGASSTAVRVTSTGSSNSGELQGRTVIATLNMSDPSEVQFCGTAPGLAAC